MSPEAPLAGEAAPSLAFVAGMPAVALLLAIGFALSGAGSTTVWYVVRATGVVAYVLVTLTVVAGLLVSNRVLPPGQKRVDAFEAHRFTALLAISVSAFHALALLLDAYIGFSPSQVLVPFTSEYRPVAVGLGILTLYLSMAVYSSFFLKRWIGQKTWRALHYATFAVFALATYHGILSGADTGQVWMLGLYLSGIVSVLGLVVYRVLKESESPAGAPSVRSGRRGLSTVVGRGSPGPGAEDSWRRPEPNGRRAPSD